MHAKTSEDKNERKRAWNLEKRIRAALLAVCHAGAAQKVDRSVVCAPEESDAGVTPVPQASGCAPGLNPCPVKGGKAFACARPGASGDSEIRKISCAAARRAELTSGA